MVSSSEHVRSLQSACQLLEKVNNIACLSLSPWTLATKYMINNEVEIEKWFKGHLAVGKEEDRKESGIGKRDRQASSHLKKSNEAKMPQHSEVTLNEQSSLGHMDSY